MMTAFHGLIRRLDRAEERISGIWDISIESLKPHSEENDDNKKLNKIFKDCGKATKRVIRV